MTPATPFEILPAIDLRGGRVVRLRQGDFDRETEYDADPAGVAEGFAALGAPWIHLVDLDGARQGRSVQGDVIRVVLEAVGEATKVEVAGGLRSRDAVEAVLGAGATRAVLGTAALADPGLARSLVATHGTGRVAIAIDVRAGLALGHGWAAGQAGVDAGDAIETLADAGVTTFEVTAIERDGLLGGPDFALYERLVRLDRGSIIASGGITTRDDLRALRELGCAGAIVGRAIYEGRIDLGQAIALG